MLIPTQAGFLATGVAIVDPGAWLVEQPPASELLPINRVLSRDSEYANIKGVWQVVCPPRLTGLPACRLSMKPPNLSPPPPSLSLWKNFPQHSKASPSVQLGLPARIAFFPKLISSVSSQKRDSRLIGGRGVGGGSSVLGRSLGASATTVAEQTAWESSASSH